MLKLRSNIHSVLLLLLYHIYLSCSRVLKTKRTYKEMDSQAIFLAMNSLVNSYPELVKLQSAQEVFGFPALGEEDDCPFDLDPNNPDDDGGCKTWILTIEDNIVHPDGSTSHERLPEVFISGGMYGDERVGPTVIVETATLLLEAAYCESLPHGTEPEKELKESKIWKDWEEELKKAKRCRSQLSNMGIRDKKRKWIARLVSTRRIVMVPTVNSLGYFRKTKKEDGIDPASDFPFDVQDATDCMKSVAARTINELFRSHLFQIAISFYSGNMAITRSWGSPTYLENSPPDDIVFDMISEGFSKVGGVFKWNKDPYPVGMINEELGPRRGRFEDWAYAGSWTTQNKDHQCKPYTYGGYDESSTSYTDSMLRVSAFKIHTSRTKSPPNNHFGDTKNLFDSKNLDDNGHVNRNLRLLLMAIDIVEPYLTITKINGIELQDDFVPLSPRSTRSCIKTKAVSIPSKSEIFTIQWIVGGGFQVETTSIMYAKWDDLPDEFDGISQPSKELLQKIYDDIDGDEGTFIKESPGGKGKSIWYSETLSDDKIVGPTFSTSFDSQDFEEGDKIAVFAVAQLDKNWLDKPSDVKPDFSPQTHLANARTNPDWYYENAEHVIQGRTLWFSVPATLIFGPSKQNAQEVSVRISHVKHKKVEEVVDVSVIIFGFIVTWFCFGCLQAYIDTRDDDDEEPITKRAAGKSYIKIFEDSTQNEKEGDLIELS